MKRKIFAAMAAVVAALIFAGCSNNKELQIYYEVALAPSIITAGGEGEVCRLKVQALGEWKIVIDERDRDWLTAEPSRGRGDATVRLTIGPNANTGYSTRIFLVAGETQRQTVINLDGRRFASENFDAGIAPGRMPYPEVAQYGGWQKKGMGGGEVSYEGSGVVVTSNFGSAGYDGASGDNNIMFDGAGSWFLMKEIDLSQSEEKPYTLSFGCAKIDAGYYLPFNMADLTVSVSFDGAAFLPLTCARGNGDQWDLATASFNLYISSKLYIKFEAHASGIFVDDIRLGEGTGAVGGGNIAVATGDASQITRTSAAVSAGWIYTGLSPIVLTEFEYYAEDSPATVTTLSGAASSATAFGVSLTGLIEGETYFYRAHIAAQDGSEAWGAWKQFSTRVDAIAKRISDIRARFLTDPTDKLPAAWTIRGVVVSDAAGGNFDGAKFAVTDGINPGDGLTVCVLGSNGQPAAHTVAVGDSVAIPMTGVRFGTAAGQPVQIDVLASQIVSWHNATSPQPIVLAAGANLQDYESMLVRLDNTMPDAGYLLRPWGPALNETAGANTTPMELSGSAWTCNAATLASASFRLQRVGTKKGSLTGVAARVGAGYCICPRNVADLPLVDERTDIEVKNVYIEPFTATKTTKLNVYTNPAYPGVTFSSDRNSDGSTGVVGDVRTVNNQNPSVCVISGVTCKWYGAASGEWTLFFGQNPNSERVYIMNVNTMGVKSMSMHYGAAADAGVQTSTGTIRNWMEYSVDGATWSPLTCSVVEDSGRTVPAGTTGGWAWVEVDGSYALPETATLSFRFTLPTSKGNCRMDDIQITTYAKKP